VIFSSDYYEELCQLSGDVGGKKVLYRHREDTRLVEIPEYELEDMDTPDRLEKYFPFLEERDHVISIVGAGGKSTLMDTLAKIYANKGKKVVVTTTTHIGKPKQHPVAYNTCDLKQLFQKRQIVVAGEDASEYKLRASQQMGITDYQASADIVLIEADGAKHFPSKVPIETEPVIVSESDIVIGVMGMDAIGITLKEGCFRLERAMEVLKTDAQHVMTVADAAAILSSDWGTRKNVENKDYYIVLNKCDNQIRRRYAEEIKELLAARGIFQVSCISLRYGNFLDVM
jgi:probable selenium-dependent hydroxylase accessory protein YqeC